MSEETPNALDTRASAADDGTSFASFRTQLALDRTMLAWIRTTLAMVSFGFGTVAFFRSLRLAHPGEETRRLHEGAIAFGLGLIVLGLVTMVFAGLSHWLTLRRLRRGERPILSQWPLTLTVTLLLAVLGLVGLGVLYGIN